jgi:hypothetical protein
MATKYPRFVKKVKKYKCQRKIQKGNEDGRLIGNVPFSLRYEKKRPPVLKTSGTTGHLPSPLRINSLTRIYVRVKKAHCRKRQRAYHRRNLSVDAFRSNGLGSRLFDPKKLMTSGLFDYRLSCSIKPSMKPSSSSSLTQWRSHKVKGLISAAPNSAVAISKVLAIAWGVG